MDLEQISLEPIRRHTVAILGYGNQGRTHALNLRDSGVSIVVGARLGKGYDQAVKDGFRPVSPPDAARKASIVMFLFPDEVIPDQYQAVREALAGKKVGFCHGFAYHYRLIERLSGCSYFLVGPKGPGAVLRERYLDETGLPGVFAIEANDEETREIAQSYAKALGIRKVLIETTFQEETECDLFGEQAVLCGGIFELMEQGFQTLTQNGHSPEMAFFETCFEAKLILELWMKYGPKGVREKISPTAFYGGLTRGKRLIDESTRQEMQNIFTEIRNGEFAREWMEEVKRGMPELVKKREEVSRSQLEKMWEKL